MIFQTELERDLWQKKQDAENKKKQLAAEKAWTEANEAQAVVARPRGSDLQPQTDKSVREFGTGATRDLDANKLDFEGFLSPLVLERYAEHMHKARRMPDGSMRESDNWQLGIPVGVYIKSLWRHFFAVWKLWRGLPVTEVVKGETIVKDLETELCALLFNASGMLHETLKAKRVEQRQSSRTSPFEP